MGEEEGKTLSDALRDGLEDLLTKLAAVANPSEQAAEQMRSLVTPHALCRIADALEKRAARESQQAAEAAKALFPGPGEPEEDQVGFCFGGENAK